MEDNEIVGFFFVCVSKLFFFFFNESRWRCYVNNMDILKNWLDSDSYPATVLLIKVILGWVNSTCCGQPHDILIFVMTLALTFFRFGHDFSWFRSSNR